ncbi:MAG: response regulator, partial [Verrucomicrobiota bacterium]
SPLAELLAAVEQFRHGRLDQRCGYAARNELGALATAFNSMAETIQTEIKIEHGAALLAGVMLREEEVHGFCRELLNGLLQHTGSQIGAVYFLNDAKTEFEHFESIGLGARGRAAFSAAGLEGELGTAVASRRIQHIQAIPEDTRFAFAAASGEFRPREILTIPVLSDHTVLAVVSLASIRAYDAASIRLVHDIWSVLTARVNGVLAFRKIQDLAERLDQQNRELNTQKRELAAQASALAEQNAELEMQKHQLDAQASALAKQNTELEMQKRELATQASALTEQNTELEMQKHQLDEANRLKSAFLSNMSHELRTPLNSVIALTGVLNRRLAKSIPAEESSYLEIIERNGKNLLLLINDILDLSRIEAGREEITVNQFAIRELADELVAMIEPQAAQKGTALASTIGQDLPPLTSDFVKCRHILQNLVGNAVKFTEQGRVTLSARLAGSDIFIAVADTGIGIAAEHLPHIFDEFRQADGSTSRKYGGTGLGLAIASKYALLLGGGITVESAPGQGSTFTLRLPLVLASPGVVEPVTAGKYTVPRTAAPSPAGPGKNLLVVEDSEPAIIQLTDILQAEGYRIQVARNGKEALAQVALTVPDAMILDLMMPEVDGFAVLKEVRGRERTSQLPVLILTAKHVNKAELSFLKGNHIYQLIQKGDINKHDLLAAVAGMVTPPAPPPPAPVSRRRATRPGQPVVLVVEDNPDSLRTARALLAGHYQVIEATDGQAGLEQARRHQPDLILMDIAMPGVDGIQALKEIRADGALRHIPVIAATASAMVGDREAILAHGFYSYISKPIDAELLLKTLREALD